MRDITVRSARDYNGSSRSSEERDSTIRRLGPQEDELHIVADPIVQEELLKEYPEDKLQSSMK